MFRSFVKEQKIISDATLTGNWEDTTSGFRLVAGYKTACFWVEYTTGWTGATSASTLKFRILGCPSTSETGNDFQEIATSTSTYTTTLYGHVYSYQPDDGSGSAEVPTSSKVYRRFFKVDIQGYSQIKLQAKEVLGGGGTPVAGTLSVSVTLLN